MLQRRSPSFITIPSAISEASSLCIVFSETLRMRVEMSFMLAFCLFFITDNIASLRSCVGGLMSERVSFICPLSLHAGSTFLGACASWRGTCSFCTCFAMSESVGVSSRKRRGSSYSATSCSSTWASRDMRSAFILERRPLVRAMESTLESASNSRERVLRAAPEGSIAAFTIPIPIDSIRLRKDAESANAGAMR